MKLKLLFILFVLPAFVWGQTPDAKTIQFKAFPPVNSKDSLAYIFTGKIGGNSWLYNAEYLRAKFIRWDDTLGNIATNYALNNLSGLHSQDLINISEFGSFPETAFIQTTVLDNSEQATIQTNTAGNNIRYINLIGTSSLNIGDKYPDGSTAPALFTVNDASHKGIVLGRNNYTFVDSSLVTKKYVDAAIAGATTGVASFGGRTGIVVPLSTDYSTFYGTLSQQNTNITNIGTNYTAIGLKQPRIISALPTQTTTRPIVGDSVNKAFAKIIFREDSLASALSVKIGANPSASLGLTAINGSSTSFMRADAAPALSVAIAPTWTGVHRFSPSVTASSGLARGSYFTPTLTASANNDQLVSMDFGATYTPGAFTGTQSLDIRSAIGIATDRSNGAYYFSVGSSGVRGKISSNTSNDLIFSVQGTEIFRILGANGHFNIGGGAIDKGFLFLPAGSSGSTALNIATWTAPHSTATSGDIGNDGTNLHYTDASLNDRKLANLESPTFTGNAGFTNINSAKVGNLVTANTPTAAATDSIVVKNAATLKFGAVKTLGVSQVDTVNVRTVANSYSLSGMQTKLNSYTSTLVDNILSKTANYTVVSGDFVAGKKTTLDLYVDATAGNVTITLPAASTLAGYTIYVTKTDASVNIVTINTVLGSNTLITQYQERQFNNDATNWYNH